MKHKKLSGHDLGRKSEAEFEAASKIPIIAVLDNIRSGLNVGSVLRTADAFRIEEVFLCGITAIPPQKDILKSSLGAERTVKWRHFNDTVEALEWLSEAGYLICSIEQAENAVMLDDFPINRDSKYALVLGNEVRGVSQEVIDASHHCLEVPMQGTKHSLNISVCAGIVLWHFFSHFALTAKLKD